MKSTWEGILASIFNGFRLTFGSKLGRKIEPRGIKNGIEKTMKKWRATKWPKGRNMDPLHRLTPGVKWRLDLLLRLFGHLVALHFFIDFSMPFLKPLGSIFPPNLPPKIHQNPSKIDAKMPSQVDLIFWSIFVRILLPTSTPRTQFGTSGLAPNAIFHIFWELNFWCDFGANMPPFSLQKSTKILPKIDPKMHQFFDRF